MKFSDFMSIEAIRAELAAQDKESVIEELVTALATSDQVNRDEQDSIVKAIMMSTFPLRAWLSVPKPAEITISNRSVPTATWVGTPTR